ncbi:MAG: hypothetical protein D3922_03870 [Candidatus Electrothrix sp. AR1]|nr:hypothetical protein [Candidatus Electrothrix sp. AR1]
MKKRHIAIQRLFFAVITMLLLPIPSWGYEKEIDTLSTAMAEKIAKAGKGTVAVVDFTDLDGNVTQLGRFIAEELSGALAEKGQGFEVVNRSNLKLILKEHKLFEKGVIDGKAAMRLGEIAGVQALVTGTITPFTENVRLSVSVLDINTAKIIENKRENIPRTTDINELLGKEITVVKQKEDKHTGGKQPQSGSNDSFSDDFNMGPKSDWKPAAGNWTMANGKYTVTNIEPKVPYSTLLKGKKWRDLIVNIDVSPGYTTNSSRGWSSSGWYVTNICPRIISLTERVCFGMAGKQHSFSEAYWYVKKEGATGEHAAKVPIETPAGQPVSVKIEVKGSIFTAYVNDTEVNKFYDTTFASGSVGLLQWYENWSEHKIRIAFDNIEIIPLAD